MADLKTDLKEVLDAIKNHPTHKYTSLMALGFLEGNGEAILRAIENDERYRWLRDPPDLWEGDIVELFLTATPEESDAAIDAAIDAARKS
jgi:hypothetical protein